jgi:FAD/FMN-containing dehydrogenase
MSGGPLSSGWIVDMTRYMTSVDVDPISRTARVAMGARFRDVEDRAREHGLMFAAYPSSHRICGIGGMIGNNASGEKSLRNGPTSANVLSLDVVRADGSTETIAPKPIADATTLHEQALIALYEQFGAQLTEASGDVPKAASGYRLDKVVQKDVFSAIPLFVGAQGTLGIATSATLKLVPIPEHLALIAISARSPHDISHIVDIVRRHNPEGLETFDAHTFAQAQKHMADDAAKFLPYCSPDAKLYLLAQFSEDTKEATHAQQLACMNELKSEGFIAAPIETQVDIDAAWNIRRHAFLLMRDYNEKGHKAVPCIEDVIVPLPALGTFIDELTSLLARRELFYGFHGHIGDGSLRVIPVFDVKRPNVANEILSLMDEVFTIIKRLHGNISADHSDGIIRSPFLKQFYGEALYNVFLEIKKLYDPRGIMNPTKKLVQNNEQIGICIDCE